MVKLIYSFGEGLFEPIHSRLSNSRTCRIESIESKRSSPKKENFAMQYRSLKRVTEPVVEPVSITQCKSHLRIQNDFQDDDEYLIHLIGAARRYVEDIIDRTLITTQWTMVLDSFPVDEIELPRPPVSQTETTTVITYVSQEDGTQTLSDTLYRVDADATPGIVSNNYGLCYPGTLDDRGSVSITWYAGYGDSTKVPPQIKHAILFLVGHWYANREPVVAGSMSQMPLAVNSLLASVSWGANA